MASTGFSFWLQDLSENEDLFDLANLAACGKLHIGDPAFHFTFKVETADIRTTFPIFVHQGGDEFTFAGIELYFDRA